MRFYGISDFGRYEIRRIMGEALASMIDGGGSKALYYDYKNDQIFHYFYHEHINGTKRLTDILHPNTSVMNFAVHYNRAVSQLGDVWCLGNPERLRDLKSKYQDRGRGRPKPVASLRARVDIINAISRSVSDATNRGITSHIYYRYGALDNPRADYIDAGPRKRSPRFKGERTVILATITPNTTVRSIHKMTDDAMKKVQKIIDGFVKDGKTVGDIRYAITKYGPHPY